MIRDSLKLMQQTPSDRFRFVGLESLTFASYCAVLRRWQFVRLERLTYLGAAERISALALSANLAKLSRNRPASLFAVSR